MTTPAWQRQVMKRVGLVLMLIGVADVAACGVAVANRVSYHSSLNVFVLIAGLMVYREHLGAVRFVVRWFSFMLGGCLLLPLSLVVVGFIAPSWWELSVTPARVLMGALTSVALVALLFWVRQSLARLPVFEGSQPARPFMRTPEAAVGAAIPIILAVAFVVFSRVGLLD